MINDIIKENWQKVINYRRHFHEYPELSFEEFDTSEFIASELKKMGYEVKEHIGGTGVMGILDTGRPGKVIAFRADMDALPILEETGLPFESRKTGVMHACGHDAHMAILLGTALFLSEIKESLCGVIKLLFQPGEEANGGALCMINDGALKNPDVEAVFAIHMMPGLPTGTIGIKSGYMTATDDEFYIKVYGVESHSSEPEMGINAIMIAGQILNALGTLTASSLNPFDAATLSVCKITGGDAINIIPNEVEMSGMVRSVEKANKLKLRDRMKAIVENTAKAYGGKAEIDFVQGFPSVNNDCYLTEVVKKAAAQSLDSPEDIITIGKPHMGSEDFAYYQEVISGAILMLGCDHISCETGSLHSSILNINEDSLEYGVSIFGNIAIDLCGRTTE